MPTLFKKHPNVLAGLFLVIFLILIWRFPSFAAIFTVIFLLFSLMLSTFLIVKKYKESYLQGEISKIAFARNVFVEISGVLLIMTLASMLANYTAEIATRQIYDGLARLIVGILLGLLVGVAVGIFTHLAGRSLAGFFKKHRTDQNVVKPGVVE